MRVLAVFAALALVACTAGYDALNPGASGSQDASASTQGVGAGSASSAGSGGSGAGAGGGTAETGGGGSGGAAAGTGGGGGAGVPAYSCTAGTVADAVDDFGGSMLGPLWGISGTSSAIVLQGGRLHIHPSAVEWEWRGVYTTAKYALEDCAVHVELRQPPVDVDQVAALLELKAGDQQWIHIFVLGGQLRWGLRDGAPPPDENGTTFDPDAHRWLRIREEDDKVYYETSEDTERWHEHANMSTPSYAQQVAINLGTNPHENTAMPQEIEFDSLNIAP